MSELNFRLLLAAGRAAELPRKKAREVSAGKPEVKLLLHSLATRYLAWKEFTDCASITFTGRLFQSLIVLGKNENRS